MPTASAATSYAPPMPGPAHGPTASRFRPTVDCTASPPFIGGNFCSRCCHCGFGTNVATIGAAKNTAETAARGAYGPRHVGWCRVFTIGSFGTVSDLVTLVRTPDLSDVAEYAYAASVRMPARLVFAAGACPLDRDGETVSPGDFVGQAHQVMANLETALAAAGARLSDVVKTTVYVASNRQADLVAVWEVVRDRFGDHHPPSTLLGVAVLGYDDQLVEVEATAAVS